MHSAHFPRSLHFPPSAGAIFALGAMLLGVGSQAAQADVVCGVQTWAAQPYWWFVENVIAWASRGFLG